MNEWKIFLKDFKSEWIDSVNHGWYEGMADKIPSTDNRVEAANNIIQGIHTLRQHFIVIQYLTYDFDMMRNW